MANRATITDDRSMIRAIPPVDFTDTWSPYHHIELLDSVDYALRAEGIQIREEKFTLTNEGLNMFGVLVLDRPVDGGFWQLGIRNSMNKAFSVGMAGGKRVTVCENLMFSGEFCKLRKHTKNFDLTEMKVMAMKALLHVQTYCDKFDSWSRTLAGMYLEDMLFKQFVYDAIDYGVFAASKFSEFHQLLEAVKDAPSRVSLDNVYDALTRMNRGKSHFLQYDSCVNMNLLVEEYQSTKGIVYEATSLPI